MNTHTENMQVIAATVGRPVPWSGNLPDAKELDPTEAVLALLKKRSEPASPMVIAKLMGMDRREVNKHLLRLKRSFRAVDIEHGKWWAVR